MAVAALGLGALPPATAHAQGFTRLPFRPPASRVGTAGVLYPTSAMYGTSATSATSATTATTGTTATSAIYPDATTFQQNAARDGYAGPVDLPAGLSPAWTKQLPGRVSYAVIAGGRLFVTTSKAGSVESAVYAFEASTGHRLWGPLVLPGSDAFDQLSYDSGRLFAVTDLGMVEALDPANGLRLWSRTSGFGSVRQLGPPLATHGHVVGSWSAPTLWSYAQSTGAVEVTANFNQSTATPAVSDGSTIYMAGGCGAGAVSMSGVIRWQEGTCSGPFGQQTAVLHAGRLWSRQGPLLPGQILSATDGSVTGSFTSDYPPAFAGSTVLLLQGHRLVAADATTQVRRWSQKADGGLDTAPVIAGQVAYVGSSSGTVYGFSLTTGAEVWHGAAGAPVVGGDSPPSYEVIQNPTIGDGVLAVPAGTTLTVFAAPATGSKPAPYGAVPVAPVTTNPPTTATYPDATAFQGNAAHDGFAGPALPGTLHERWSHTYPGQEGSPLMVGGRMFVPVVDDGALDVYAYRASTGGLLWGPVAVSTLTGAPTQNTYGGGLGYDAGRLFALSGSGLLVALDPLTGRQLWSTQLSGYYPLEPFASGPVAFGGMVYATGEAVASGVRQSDGSVVFSRYVPGDWTIPAANSRGAFLGFVSFEAMLLSPAGAVTWDTKVGMGGWGGAPVLHGSQEWVRFGFGVGVGEVHDQATGRVLRAFYSQSPPAFVGTRVVLTQDGTLAGADATTGSVFWSQAGDGYLDSPPVVAGTTAYVTSRLGSVYGFSTVTGAQTWQATLPAEGGYDDNGTLTSGFITGPMIGDGYLAVPNGHTLTVFGG